MSDNPNREPSPFVRELLPDASAEELAEAQFDYEGYLDALIRIYRRLEQTGYFARLRDKTPDRARLDEQHDA